MSIIENSPEYNGRPSSDYIHCHGCRNRVALVEDYFLAENDSVTAGFFNRLFNVEVSEDERYQKVVNGKTLAETYCVQCRNLLGWKLIAVSQPSTNYREGFYMRLDKLINWKDVPLFDVLFGGNNEQNADQDGDATEQKADHDNEQDPNEQALGANEKNADQDGDAKGQDLGINEQNADQVVGANGQNADQDEDANEQDLGSNEQNDDQDEDANEQVRGCCSCLM